jgi:hypothetical protein
VLLLIAVGRRFRMPAARRGLIVASLVLLYLVLGYPLAP